MVLISLLRSEATFLYSFILSPTPYINGALKDLLKKKRKAGLTEQADYIK